jgi:general secretion pathway protein A
MYERFYNLRERPFSLSPDPDYLYPSRVHKEALSHLRYGIEGHAAFVVITGEIGSGKTTLLQAAMRGLDARTSVARLMNTMLDGRELIEAVMLDFGLDPRPDQSKPHLLRDLAQFLVEQRMAERLPLLIIDEAQNLGQGALEEVRMLSNLETEKSKLIQIVLVGQPNLLEVLARPELEQLRQRVTVRYHLRPLDPDETALYINHRLRKAAIGAPLVFSSEVTDLIGLASQGLPRRINVIADAVLLFGYGDDKHVIDADLVREVIGDLTAAGVLAAPAAQAPQPVAAAQVRQEPTVLPAPNGTPDRARTAEDEKLRRELADLERNLRKREQDMTLRERELAEQRRVLADQIRLLKTQRQPQTAATAAWPPAAGTKPPVAYQMHAPAFATNGTKPRSSLWRRVKNTLLGTPERVLEDSL